MKVLAKIALCVAGVFLVFKLIEALADFLMPYYGKTYCEFEDDDTM